MAFDRKKVKKEVEILSAETQEHHKQMALHNRELKKENEQLSLELEQYKADLQTKLNIAVMDVPESLEGNEREIKVTLREFHKDIYIIGTRLKYIRDKELYKKTHSLFGDYTKEVFDMSTNTAYRWIRMVEKYDFDEIYRYGTKLELLLNNKLNEKDKKEFKRELVNKDLSWRDLNNKISTRIKHRENRTPELELVKEDGETKYYQVSPAPVKNTPVYNKTDGQIIIDLTMIKNFDIFEKKLKALINEHVKINTNTEK